jgi:hypothetical protein
MSTTPSIPQRYKYLSTGSWIPEGAAWRPPETYRLRDSAGTAIGSGQLSALYLTLYAIFPGSQPIVNSMNHVSILADLARYTLTVDGVFTPTLLETDTPLLVASAAYEQHCAQYHYTWNGGTKSAVLELVHVVRQVDRYPPLP